MLTLNRFGWHFCSASLGFSALFISGDALSDSLVKILRDAKEHRRQTRNIEQITLFVKKPREEMKVDVSFGAAVTSNDDGSRERGIPFEFDFYTDQSPYKFRLYGGGYTWRQQTDGSTVSGMDDLKMQGTWTKGFGDNDDPGRQTVTLGAGVQAPSYGQIGSSNWKQSIVGTYKIVLPAVTVSATGRVGHVNGNSNPNVSSTPLYGKLALGYGLGKDVCSDCKIFGIFDRSLTRGIPGANGITGEFDFPVGRILGRDIGGVVSATKGLSSLGNSMSYEFDVQWTF